MSLDAAQPILHERDSTRVSLLSWAFLKHRFLSEVVVVFLIVDSLFGTPIFANGRRIAHEDSTGKYFYHNDHLGSPILITDSNGADTRFFEYSPYGTIKSETDGSASNPNLSLKHRFNSKELDDSTNLYNYGARQYDAALARFITPDPIDFDLENPQSLNRYSYTLNNPLKYIDPTGNIAVFIGAAEVITITAVAAASIFIGARAIQSLGTSSSFPSSSINFRIPSFGSGLVGGFQTLFPSSGSISGSTQLPRGSTDEHPSFTGPLVTPASDLPVSNVLLSGKGEASIGERSVTKGKAKPSPNFIPPTNAPQLPPKNLPPGHTVRIGPPTAQYPKGYWRQYNRDGHPVDPSTGKQPVNVSRQQARAQTHVSLP